MHILVVLAAEHDAEGVLRQGNGSIKAEWNGFIFPHFNKSQLLAHQSKADLQVVSEDWSSFVQVDGICYRLE